MDEHIETFEIAQYESIQQAEEAKALLEKENIPAEIIEPARNHSEQFNDQEPIKFYYAISVPIRTRLLARKVLKQIKIPKYTGSVYLIEKNKSLIFSIIGCFIFSIIGITISSKTQTAIVIYVGMISGIVAGLLFGKTRKSFLCSDPSCGCFYNKINSSHCEACGRSVIAIVKTRKEIEQEH
jgi:hypothetical protein